MANTLRKLKHEVDLKENLACCEGVIFSWLTVVKIPDIFYLIRSLNASVFQAGHRVTQTHQSPCVFVCLSGNINSLCPADEHRSCFKQTMRNFHVKLNLVLTVNCPHCTEKVSILERKNMHDKVQTDRAYTPEWTDWLEIIDHRKSPDNFATFFG